MLSRLRIEEQYSWATPLSSSENLRKMLKVVMLNLACNSVLSYYPTYLQTPLYYLQFKCH